MPSSRFVTKRLCKIAMEHQVRTVVELGPGTGCTTRAILEALPSDGRLLAIELDKDFARALSGEADSRLMVHQGSAADYQRVLAKYGLFRPDMAVSGVPFSTLPAELGYRILTAIWDSLAPGGCFVAYQVSNHIARLGRKIAGEPQHMVEWRNVPPISIYTWHKPLSRSYGLEPHQRITKPRSHPAPKWRT